MSSVKLPQSLLNDDLERFLDVIDAPLDYLKAKLPQHKNVIVNPFYTAVTHASTEPLVGLCKISPSKTSNLLANKITIFNGLCGFQRSEMKNTINVRDAVKQLEK